MYAESPERGFMPGTGTLARWALPDQAVTFRHTGDVRVDSGVRAGDQVPPSRVACPGHTFSSRPRPACKERACVVMWAHATEAVAAVSLRKSAVGNSLWSGGPCVQVRVHNDPKQTHATESVLALSFHVGADCNSSLIWGAMCAGGGALRPHDCEARRARPGQGHRAGAPAHRALPAAGAL